MMKRRNLLISGLVSLLSISSPWSAQAQASREDQDDHAGGAVFTVGNQAGQNQVFALARSADGTLGAPVAFDAGGAGTGASLGSQGALVLTEDRRFLVVVNAGSNEISSFAVHGSQLELRHVVSSGGQLPVSVTERRGRVYVVNAQSANVAGFQLDLSGHLHTIAGSSQPLSSPSASPAQVQISPDGRLLVVTERATNVLSTYEVDWLGRVEPGQFQQSEGNTPFGFDITRHGELVVSEAAPGSASAYQLEPDGRLTVLSSTVSDTQSAPCWVVLSKDERYAFVANAASSSISSYRLSRTGEIALVNGVAGDVGPASHPLDMALAESGNYLYVLDRGNAGIAGFTVQADGNLASIDFTGTLPPFASGLAAY